LRVDEENGEVGCGIVFRVVDAALERPAGRCDPRSGGADLLLEDSVDDFSAQLIIAVKFREDLHGLRNVSIANSKIDPAVSHIFGRLLTRRFCALGSLPVRTA